jgi:phage terminase Nu1 subunit (DNA packaging protein)
MIELHPQTISKLIEEGLPVAVRGRGGRASRFNVAAVQQFMKNRRSAGANGPAVNVAHERARKERAQARLAEQVHALRERELLPAQEVEKVWSAHVAAVRAKLLAWPSTLTDRLARAFTLDGIAGLERELNEAVRDVLRELAASDVPKASQPVNGSTFDHAG